MAFQRYLRGIALFAILAFNIVDAATLTVSTTGGNASSPLLYGIMFEDINNSGDGGIHGQLLRNNGFQGTSPNLTAYAAVGGATLSVDTANPLSSALPHSLKVTIPSNTTGQVGFTNEGYLGVPVNADTYANYFWMKGTYAGSITLSLVGNSSGTVYATQTITVNSNSSAFGYYETSYTSAQAPDGNNVWKLTFDGAAVTGSALYFGLPQLFPSTYHARYNGLRNDVGNFMAAMQPSFLRFPGGNNLEGATPANRWQWNATIGPVVNRPGRQGDWGYPNTDALGLMEYLQWCEDTPMTPLLAVWAGLSLAGGGVLTGTALTPYITDILNELEFLLGDTSTTYGALRSQYGHAAPYNIPMIEVGNEDNTNGGCATYASRFTAIYNAIHAAYPNITIITSTSSASCLPNPLPSGVWTDTHHYLSPSSFVNLFNEWDNIARVPGFGIFVGEYASTQTDNGTATYWSTVQGAIAEAVYMIGMERNSDLVKMASYAPMFEHFSMAEWSPNLAGLDSDPGSLTGSASYYVQQLFSTHRGSTILPVTADVDFGPLYWVASSTVAGVYYVKIANYGTMVQNVTVRIPGVNALALAKLVVFTGPVMASNYPLNVTVLPVTTTVEGSVSEGWGFGLPGYGVAVLTVTV